MFLEQADEVCGGFKVQLDGDVGNRERGVLQLSAGLGQNLVEDVGLGRLAKRLAHDLVQVVGRDAEAVGIELRAVLLAEVVAYELYEVIHTLRRIWETFGKHYEHELHILHTLFLHVLCHPQHPLVDIVGEFSLHRQGYDNVGGDAKTFRREVLLVEA